MEKVEKNSKRQNYIDIAKVIGIFFVVLGHTEFFGKDFLYQFHLPLFFFMSGVVFNEKNVKEPKKFILKRIKGLYLPFIIFELIFLLLHNFLVDINFYTELSNFTLKYSFNDILKNALKILTLGGGEQLAGPLWFLISTFEINIIFAIILKILNKFNLDKKREIILVVLSIILFYIGCYTDLPRMLSQSFIGLLFYCCGFVFKQYINRIDFNIVNLIISIVILTICSIFNEVDISQLDITYKFLLILSGLSGTYIILWISKKIKALDNKFILYCGRNTLYILALHCLFFKFVMLLEIFIYKQSINNLGMFPVYQHSQLWVIPLTLIGFIGPVIIKYLVDNIKLLKNKIIGGYLCRKSL